MESFRVPLQSPATRRSFQGSSIPAAEKGVDEEAEIGQEGGAGHVFSVQLPLGGQNHGVNVGVQMIFGHAGKNSLLAGKDDGRHAGDSRAARQFEGYIFRQFGAGTDQAHIPGQYIRKLGQLIQLPAAQEGADGSKALMVGRGDSDRAPFRQRE